MNFGKASGQSSFGRGRAPDRGSFPPDHLHECDDYVEKYFICLRDNRMYAPKCRKEAQLYLICRRKHGLMSQEDFEAAIFPKPDDPYPDYDPDEYEEAVNEIRRQKFIPGVGYVSSTKK